MDPGLKILAGALVIWAAITNGLWYRCKYILKTKGYRPRWIGNHWQNLPDMNEVIRNEGDPGQKRRYRRLLRTIYCLLAVGPLLFLIYAVIFLGENRMTQGP